MPTTPQNVTGVGKYMAVLKDEKFARAIFDLRWTNERTILTEISFKIPSTAELIQALVDLGDCTKKRFRFLHGDIKNWYYQIPITPELGSACCIRQGSSNLRPTVLPMGYKLACGIAQSIMWGILTYRDHNPTELDGLESALTDTRAPGIVLLHEGGFIALMYDSFLIVSTESTLKRWHVNLKYNFRKFNVVAKYMTMEKNTCQFTYCGIRIIQKEGHISWMADPTVAETWSNALKNLVEITPRILFQFCGYVRHVSAILGIPPRELGRLTKYQSELGLVDDWDAKLLSGCARDVTIETSFRVIRENSHPHNWKMYRRYIKGKRIFYAVVDATTTRLAVWPMSDSKPVNSQIVEQTCQMEIVLAEATAISEAIRMAIKFFQHYYR